MIIDNASIIGGKFDGIDDHIFWSEIKKSEITGNISGTIHMVQFEDCIFKDAVFSTDLTAEFVGCSFQNCIFTKNVKGQGVTFIECKNRMNGILFR